MLRDPAFRVALDYAIDRERIIQLVYNGRAKAGYTMITADTWRDPDFHWEPPDEVKRTFDLEKAKQLLDAAGYKDTDGDGVREDKKGKPISLRLWALAESTSTQGEGKLLAGWFESVGLKIRFEVVDNGVASDAMYAWKGDSPAPDYDMILWFWDGYYDPGSTLQCFTTSQIGWWNEVYWSSAEYDALCEQQGRELDPQVRAEQIWRMQEVMYAENPQNVLTYFDYLQAVNTEKWEGWTPYYDEDGPVFYNGMIQSYLNVGPKTGTAAGSEASSGGGSTGHGGRDRGRRGGRGRRGAVVGAPPPPRRPGRGGLMRARDLGIELGLGTPGPLNAITDVAGVRVGCVTLIDGEAGPAGGGGGAGAHRRHGDRPARGRDRRGAAVRRLPHPQRLRRLHRPRVDPRERDAHLADRADQHVQPRRGARRPLPPRGRRPRGARPGQDRLLLQLPRRRRDVGRRAERHRRPARARGAPVRCARRGRRRAGAGG